jgi:hypothetical protein
MAVVSKLAIRIILSGCTGGTGLSRLRRVK